MAIQKLIFAGVFTLMLTFNTEAQVSVIQCPADTLFFGSDDTNHGNYWNEQYWWDPKINSHDLAEEEVLLECTGMNNCPTGGLSFRYILTLSLDQDTSQKTVIDSDSLPGTNIVYFNNKENDLFSGEARVFDERPVLPNQRFRFDIKLDTPGLNIWKAHVNWTNLNNQNYLPQIPYGTHHIKWIVSDECGNTAVCAYFFNIKDTLKPELDCFSGISTNLQGSGFSLGSLQLWAGDILNYTKDNYTPSARLIIGIRKAGTGSGFPYNQDGTPQTSVVYACSDLGSNEAELWSIDLDGNTSSCITSILIQDNQSSCEGPMDISGKIVTNNTEGIENVTVDIAYQANGLPTIFTGPVYTNVVGNYYSNWGAVSVSSAITITPTMELDPLNGVNTWDLVLISRHILGLEPLNSVYKLISADANKSGIITTFDVVELRKLILGTYPVLPNNASWRFVQKQQTFANPLNPFAEVIRENAILTSFYNCYYCTDFIGCKIGDVDLTATPNNLSEPEDRNKDISFLTIQNRQVKKGETFTTHFDRPPEITALQYTLNTRGLKPVQIIPGPGLTADHFGMFSGGDKDVFAPAFTTAIENSDATFNVTFTALTDDLLSNMLQISGDITPAMAFGENGKGYDPVLRFVEEKEADNQPVLFQNTPNPWSESTFIPFYLQEEEDIRLDIFDLNGVVVYSDDAHFPAGNHRLEINKKAFAHSGVYYYRLQTAGVVSSETMIFIHH